MPPVYEEKKPGKWEEVYQPFLPEDSAVAEGTSDYTFVKKNRPSRISTAPASRKYEVIGKIAGYIASVATLVLAWYLIRSNTDINLLWQMLLTVPTWLLIDWFIRGLMLRQFFLIFFTKEQLGLK